MAVDLKSLTPDTSLPTDGFLFGADSQAAASPSVFSTQTVATTLLGSTALTTQTVTTSQPLLNLAQTWNASAVTFTGLFFNAASGSNTNSASASKLIDLQLEGATKFAVRKDGQVTVNYPVSTEGFLLIGNGNGLIVGTGGGDKTSFNPYGVRLRNTATLSWGSTADGPASADTTLLRDTTNTLALRNGTSAQAFNIYNTYTDAANYERLSINWNSNDCYLSIQTAGTGANRKLKINALSFEFLVGGSTCWIYNSTGHISAYTDNAYDIGASGTGRPRNIYAGNSIVAAVNLSASAAFVTYVGLGSSGSATSGTIYGISDGVFRLSNAASSGFDRLQFGGTTSAFPALKRSTTTLQARLADDSAYAAIQGKLTTDTAYTAGAPTATGYITIYDSTGTAYKVPASL